MPQDYEVVIAAERERRRRLREVGGELKLFDDGDPDFDAPDPVPSVSYGGREAHLLKADYTVLTVFVPPSCGPTYSRKEHVGRIEDRLPAVYGDWLAHDAAFYIWGAHLYAKIEVASLDGFPPFERFLERNIASWGRAGIAYVFDRPAIGRVNAVLYDRRDNLPPHPDAIRGDDPETREERVEQHVAWKTYHREGEPPRYEYRPAYVLNGDYGADGFDAATWSDMEFDLDLRCDVAYENRKKSRDRDFEDGATSFPDARETMRGFERLPEIVPEYGRYLEVEELDLPYRAPGEAGDSS